MKTAKRLLAALLAALLTLSLAACGSDGGGAALPSAQTAGEDFQKNMHQLDTVRLNNACETDQGIYFEMGTDAHYIEKDTKRETILCGKPECTHEDRTCNAYLSGGCLWFYDGKLYFSNGNMVEENGKMVDYGDRLYSLDPDGSNRRPVQKLEFEIGGEKVYAASPILHRGVVYFAYNGVLYSLPLGGDIEDAEYIWGEKVETDDGPIQLVDPNQRRYTLWADGETFYFMTNDPQPDGMYKETLYACDIATREVTKAWETPDADEVGEWETTGVSVTQWYVLDGVIYFYLSGGDFWKTDLATGETVKLADVHEKAASGSAVFSDDYLCVVNDEIHRPAFLEPSDATGRHLGDTVYVYSLEGELAAELSLASLYDELDGLLHIQPAFCSGEDFYFVANTQGEVTGSDQQDIFTGVKRTYNYIVYCVNIKSGEITQIFDYEL